MLIFPGDYLLLTAVFASIISIIALICMLVAWLSFGNTTRLMTQQEFEDYVSRVSKEVEGSASGTKIST